MALFVIMIGQDIANIKPYKMNKKQPTIFTNLSLVISFNKKEVNTAKEAKYPIISVVLK
tara:strand:- start:290 stop:466 length:177 start_codon:yes stop_codon:yes gene_type:complete